MFYFSSRYIYYKQIFFYMLIWLYVLIFYPDLSLIASITCYMFCIVLCDHTLVRLIFRIYIEFRKYFILFKIIGSDLYQNSETHKKFILFLTFKGPLNTNIFAFLEISQVLWNFSTNLYLFKNNIWKFILY